jgi:hypothetical protein
MPEPMMTMSVVCSIIVPSVDPLFGLGVK